MRTRLLPSYFPILLALILSPFLTHCGLSSNKNPNQNQVLTVPDVSIGAGEEFNPTADTSTTANESEEPIEETCDQFDTPAITPQKIDFGLGEVGQEECQTIHVRPACVNFAAEIDKNSSTSQVNGSNEIQEVSEFFMKSGTNEVIGRFTGKGEVSICYRRAQVSTQAHVGRVNLVLEGGSHAAVVSLVGQTLPSLFSIHQPVENLLVWERPNGSPIADDGTRLYRSYFNIETSGMVNQNLASLFSKNEIIVSVTNGGITQKTSFNEDGSFGPLTLEIPNTSRVYPVRYCLETTKGKLCHSKPVIRFGKPAASIEIRDENGNLVNFIGETPEDAATNSLQLSAGIRIKNLASSAPSDLNPVILGLKIKKTSGEEITVLDNQRFYHGYDKSTQSGECGLGFDDEEAVFCFDLPRSTALNKGFNEITATICNDVTDFVGECETVTTSLIVDNDKPIITITSPTEGQLFDNESNETIKLTGTIENFVPFVETENTDTGETEMDCVAKLFVNTSHLANKGNGFIPLCDHLKDAADEDSSETTGNKGNIKKAHFEVELPVDGFEVETDVILHKLTLYTNLIHIQAEDKNGHHAFKTLSFFRGKESPFDVSPSIINQNRQDVFSAPLGDITSNGTVKNPPLAFTLPESLIKSSNGKLNAEVIAVIEHILNSEENGIKFMDIVQGGSLPGDENSNNIEDPDETIDLEANLGMLNNETFWTMYDDSRDTKKRRWIWENLHSTMPQKVRSLIRYRTLKYLNGEANGPELENLFFKNNCSENDPEKQWDVACDACRNKIPISVVTYDTYQFIYKNIYTDYTSRLEWPRVLSDKTKLNNFIQGRWKIGNLDLKDNGYIDADICLVGEGDIVDGCDDVPDNNFHKPALWGHAAAFPLIQGGITGLINDPIIPLLFNVGKVRLNFKNVLQIKKIRLANETYTNRLIIHKNRIIDGLHGSIQLEPYLNCENFYHQEYGFDVQTPFGCDSRGKNFPVAIDLTAPAGQLLWADVGEEGKNTWILTVLRDELPKAFKNIISCLGTEIINPIIEPENYPLWVGEDDKISLTLSLDDVDDEFSIVQAKDAVNPIFTFELNAKDADLNIQNGSVDGKFPLRFGINNIDGSVGRSGSLYRLTPEVDYQNLFNQKKIEDPNQVELSVDLEKLLHNVFTLALKKGINPILDLFDIDELTPPADHPVDDWTLSVDQVVFARFDICKDIAGLLQTSLPPSLIFSQVSNLFEDDSVHLDLIIDPNSPPTLALLPPEQGSNHDVTAQIGLSNIIVDVRDMVRLKVKDRLNEFSIGPSILKLRLDGLVKLGIKWIDSDKRLEIYIPPLDEHALYTSVLESPSFDDLKITDDLWQVLLVAAFERIQTTEPNKPSFAFRLPRNLSEFDFSETYKITDDEVLAEARSPSTKGLIIEDHTSIASNEDCEDLVKEGKEPIYVGEMRQQDKESEQVIDAQAWKSLVKCLKNEVESVEDIVKEDLCGCTTNVVENSIQEALCEDIGIQEITIDPTVIFDHRAGAVHVSTPLKLEVYDWIWEQTKKVKD